MKRNLYVLCLLGMAFGCGKKGDAVVPDAAARIAGTYEVTSVQTAGQVFPYPVAFATPTGAVGTQSAQFVAVRKTESSVSLTYTERTTGEDDITQELGLFTIKGNDLSSGATQAGTCDGTTLAIDLVQQGVHYAITSKRR